MSAPAASPVHACVAFLRIPEFASRSAARQAAQKERLEARARPHIERLAPEERVVLEADDGLALVMFVDPARALDVGQAFLADGGDQPLQAGLSIGPLAVTSRASDGRVFGDALSGAAAAARFAEPGTLLATEHFARALGASSPGRASELVPAGEFTDTEVRLHRFFAPDPARRAVRRRRLALYSIGGVVAILLLGVIGRDIYQPMFRTRPAIVKLEIKPRGEVFVDGVSRGRTPPLTEIEVPPGRRRIQVRNPGSAPLDVTLELKPAQRLTLTHTFARPPEPKSDLWRDLKRKFGS